MPSHLPLPALAHAPRGFHLEPLFGRTSIELIAPDGRSLGRLVGTEHSVRRLGLLPSPSRWDVDLLLAGSGPVLRASWVPALRGGFPELALTDPAGEPLAWLRDWSGRGGRLDAPAGQPLGAVEVPDALAASLLLRDAATGAEVTVRRLDTREREATGLVQGGELFAFEGDAKTLDGRLLLAWAYGLAMRALAC